MTAAEKIRATWDHARGVKWDWRELPVFRAPVPLRLRPETEPLPAIDAPAPYDVVDFRYHTEQHFVGEIAVITGTLDGVSVEVVREPTARAALSAMRGEP